MTFCPFFGGDAVRFSEGHHAGDMPNLHIPQSGELVVEVLNPAITLEQGKPNSVFGPNGHSYRDPCRCRRLQDRSGRQCRRTHRLRRDHVALALTRDFRLADFGRGFGPTRAERLRRLGADPTVDAARRAVERDRHRGGRAVAVRAGN